MDRRVGQLLKMARHEPHAGVSVDDAHSELFRVTFGSTRTVAARRGVGYRQTAGRVGSLHVGPASKRITGVAGETEALTRVFRLWCRGCPGSLGRGRDGGPFRVRRQGEAARG